MHTHRRTLTQIRISAHKLHIETDRYIKDKRDALQRYCDTCLNKVENEYHFIIECELHENRRKILYDEINLICPKFENLEDYDKFIYLLTGENKVSSLIGKFCYESFEIRDKLGQNL